MLRKDDCITAVPILPGEVPMIPVGLRANEFDPQGREPQSIAFLIGQPEWSGCTRETRRGYRRMLRWHA